MTYFQKVQTSLNLEKFSPTWSRNQFWRKSVIHISPPFVRQGKRTTPFIKKIYIWITHIHDLFSESMNIVKSWEIYSHRESNQFWRRVLFIARHHLSVGAKERHHWFKKIYIWVTHIHDLFSESTNAVKSWEIRSHRESNQLWRKSVIQSSPPFVSWEKEWHHWFENIYIWITHIHDLFSKSMNVVKSWKIRSDRESNQFWRKSVIHRSPQFVCRGKKNDTIDSRRYIFGRGFLLNLPSLKAQ
jgi:hypothetical protein